MGTAAPPPDRLLRRPEVLQIVGLSKSQLYRLIDRGRFPKAKAIGGARRWLLSEVMAWVQAL